MIYNHKSTQKVIKFLFNLSLILVLIIFYILSGCAKYDDNILKFYAKQNASADSSLLSSNGVDTLAAYAYYSVVFVADYCSSKNDLCTKDVNNVSVCSGTHIADGYIVSSADCFVSSLDHYRFFTKTIRSLKYYTKTQDLQYDEVILSDLDIKPVIYNDFYDLSTSLLSMFFVHDIALFYIPHHQNLAIADNLLIDDNNLIKHKKNLQIEVSAYDLNRLDLNCADKRFDYNLNANLIDFIDFLDIADECHHDYFIENNYFSSDNNHCKLNDYLNSINNKNNVDNYSNLISDVDFYSSKYLVADKLFNLYVNNEIYRYLLTKNKLYDNLLFKCIGSITNFDKNKKNQFIELIDSELNITKIKIDNFYDIFHDKNDLLSEEIIDLHKSKYFIISDNPRVSYCNLVNNNNFNIIASDDNNLNTDYCDKYQNNLIAEKLTNYKKFKKNNNYLKGSAVTYESFLSNQKNTEDKKTKRYLLGFISSKLSNYSYDDNNKKINNLNSYLITNLSYYKNWIEQKKIIAYNLAINNFK